MQLRQPWLKSSTWERLRGIHMEKTGSNRSNMGEEGSGAENDNGHRGKPKKSRPKGKRRKALERTQWPGKEGAAGQECGTTNHRELREFLK